MAEDLQEADHDLRVRPRSPQISPPHTHAQDEHTLHTACHHSCHTLHTACHHSCHTLHTACHHSCHTHTHTRRATTAATHKHTRRATTAAIHTHTRRATSSRARPTPHAYVRYGADAVAGVHAHPSVAFSEEFQSDYLTAHYPPFDELRKSYAPRDLEVPPFSPPVTRSRHSRP